MIWLTGFSKAAARLAGLEKDLGLVGNQYLVS
jgi:hypothetical protein